MKVRVSIMREVEIDINDPIIEELDKYYRGCVAPVPRTATINEMVDKAVEVVEKAVGLPFGAEYAPETITNVMAMDGEPILEW